MKLAFESNLEYQLEAIRAITDIFEAQPNDASLRSLTLNDTHDTPLFPNLNTIANELLLSPKQILENVRKVQSTQGLPLSESLNGMHFTVEMETGTGKT
jgi:type III restriction enzyme